MDVSEIFFEVDDPRQSGKCYHELSDIIMIVFCGYLADCEGFEEVYDYACDKKELLSEFLELPCGIPSHDTLNRVFRYQIPCRRQKSGLYHWLERESGGLI